MKLSIFTKKITITFEKTILALCVCAASLSYVSCKSTEVVIDDSMNIQQLIQKGQNEYQNGRYKNALKCYEAVLERPEATGANYVEARYEIGHIFMKKRNFSEARPIFEEILEIFRSTMPGTLPAAYNKLAEIELAKIPNTKQAIQAKKQKQEEQALHEQTEEADKY